MRVSEAMTREVRVCNPGQSISACARMMAEIDAGVLPVADRDRLVGMINDRDIAIRAVAAGKGPDTAVGEVMSRQLLYCFDDQELDHIAKSMGEARVRRLPVIDRESSQLVGILSLGRHRSEIRSRSRRRRARRAVKTRRPAFPNEGLTGLQESFARE